MNKTQVEMKEIEYREKAEAYLEKNDILAANYHEGMADALKMLLSA